MLPPNGNRYDATGITLIAWGAILAVFVLLHLLIVVFWKGK